MASLRRTNDLPRLTDNSVDNNVSTLVEAFHKGIDSEYESFSYLVSGAETAIKTYKYDPDSSATLANAKAIYEYVKNNALTPEALDIVGINDIHKLRQFFYEQMNQDNLILFVRIDGVDADYAYSNYQSKQINLICDGNIENGITPVFCNAPSDDIKYECEANDLILFKNIDHALKFASHFKMANGLHITIVVCSHLIHPETIDYEIANENNENMVVISSCCPKTFDIQHTDSCSIFIKSCKLLSIQYDETDELTIEAESAFHTILIDTYSYVNASGKAIFNAGKTNTISIDHLEFLQTYNPFVNDSLNPEHWNKTKYNVDLIYDIDARNCVKNIKTTNCIFKNSLVSIIGCNATIENCSFVTNSKGIHALTGPQIRIKDANEFIECNKAFYIENGLLTRNIYDHGLLFVGSYNHTKIDMNGTLDMSTFDIGSKDNSFLSLDADTQTYSNNISFVDILSVMSNCRSNSPTYGELSIVPNISSNIVVHSNLYGGMSNNIYELKAVKPLIHLSNDLSNVDDVFQNVSAYYSQFFDDYSNVQQSYVANGYYRYQLDKIATFLATATKLLNQYQLYRVSPNQVSDDAYHEYMDHSSLLPLWQHMRTNGNLYDSINIPLSTLQVFSGDMQLNTKLSARHYSENKIIDDDWKFNMYDQGDNHDYYYNYQDDVIISNDNYLNFMATLDTAKYYTDFTLNRIEN